VTQILPYLAKLQIGFSQAFSVGNGADLDLGDCLEYLAEDPETKAIAVYIEGIKRSRDFIQAASKASRAKPVVALYVVGTEAGSRSAASHTGSISGPDHLYDALFRQAGVIRAGTVAGQARLEVADNGIGIPFDELPHIFEEVFRGQEAKKAVAHGTGLGMAIVKRVADVHLGKIDVQSERGKGTTFVVTFPAVVSAETPVSA
jgi:signal transduction histidine kinase